MELDNISCIGHIYVPIVKVTRDGTDDNPAEDIGAAVAEQCWSSWPQLRTSSYSTHTSQDPLTRLMHYVEPP